MSDHMPVETPSMKHLAIIHYVNKYNLTHCEAVTHETLMMSENT